VEGRFEKDSGGKRLVCSRLFEQRRMKAEEKMGIPISLRSGFAISTDNGKAANAMHAASADDKFRKAVSPFRSFVKSHL
jgi:hypothetical protein